MTLGKRFLNNLVLFYLQKRHLPVLYIIQRNKRQVKQIVFFPSTYVGYTYH